jgi:hypothetical protein
MTLQVFISALLGVAGAVCAARMGLAAFFCWIAGLAAWIALGFVSVAL